MWKALKLQAQQLLANWITAVRATAPSRSRAGRRCAVRRATSPPRAEHKSGVDSLQIASELHFLGRDELSPSHGSRWEPSSPFGQQSSRPLAEEPANRPAALAGYLLSLFVFNNLIRDQRAIEICIQYEIRKSCKHPREQKPDYEASQGLEE